MKRLGLTPHLLANAVEKYGIATLRLTSESHTRYSDVDIERVSKILNASKSPSAE